MRGTTETDCANSLDDTVLSLGRVFAKIVAPRASIVEVSAKVKEAVKAVAGPAKGLSEDQIATTLQRNNLSSEMAKKIAAALKRPDDITDELLRAIEFPRLAMVVDPFARTKARCVPPLSQ